MAGEDNDEHLEPIALTAIDGAVVIVRYQSNLQARGAEE